MRYSSAKAVAGHSPALGPGLSPCRSLRYAAPPTWKSRGFITLSLWGYVTLGGVVLLLGLGVALKVQTSRLDACKHEYAAFVAQTKAAGEAQEKKTQETIARQKRDADEAEKRSLRAVADIRGKYDRLRNASARSSVLPAIPDTGPVADATARDSRLLEVLRIAEEQTRRLEELQGWVRTQQP